MEDSCDHVSLEFEDQQSDYRDNSDNGSENSNSLKIIECRVEFVKMGKIKTVEEEFDATVKIRTTWYEDEIIKKYDPKIHWDPKIYIENAIIDVNYFQDVSYKTVTVENGTLVTEIRSCKGKNFIKTFKNFYYFINYLTNTKIPKLIKILII